MTSERKSHTALDVPGRKVPIGMVQSTLTSPCAEEGTYFAGSYHIQERVGVGRLSQVYSAHDINRDGERVALKVLSPRLTVEPHQLKRTMRDLYALMNLKSPHLVQILDVGIQNRMVYYSMEYASGSTLAETLDRGELEIPLATRYLLHLCRAVLAAHQCQVVHREVKLSNIFINKRDILQLGDIGTECHMRNQSLENTHYIAPELWLGGLSTQASDVYAVGVVAYRMFTDRMPFVATDATQMAMKHVKLAAKPLRHYSPNLPEWLADLVALMLHKNPESRPTVQDLLHRFLAQRQ